MTRCDFDARNVKDAPAHSSKPGVVLRNYFMRIPEERPDYHYVLCKNHADYLVTKYPRTPTAQKIREAATGGGME